MFSLRFLCAIAGSMLLLGSIQGVSAQGGKSGKACSCATAHQGQMAHGMTAQNHGAMMNHGGMMMNHGGLAMNHAAMMNHVGMGYSPAISTGMNLHHGSYQSPQYGNALLGQPTASNWLNSSLTHRCGTNMFSVQNTNIYNVQNTNIFQNTNIYSGQPTSGNWMNQSVAVRNQPAMGQVVNQQRVYAAQQQQFTPTVHNTNIFSGNATPGNWQNRSAATRSQPVVGRQTVQAANQQYAHAHQAAVCQNTNMFTGNFTPGNWMHHATAVPSQPMVGQYPVIPANIQNNPARFHKYSFTAAQNVNHTATATPNYWTMNHHQAHPAAHPIVQAAFQPNYNPPAMPNPAWNFQYQPATMPMQPVAAQMPVTQLAMQDMFAFQQFQPVTVQPMCLPPMDLTANLWQMNYAMQAQADMWLYQATMMANMSALDSLMMQAMYSMPMQNSTALWQNGNLWQNQANMMWQYPGYMQTSAMPGMMMWQNPYLAYAGMPMGNWNAGGGHRHCQCRP